MMSILEERKDGEDRQCNLGRDEQNPLGDLRGGQAWSWDHHWGICTCTEAGCPQQVFSTVLQWCPTGMQTGKHERSLGEGVWFTTQGKKNTKKGMFLTKG